jgi:phosphoadenosine phosphosulfate reductase
MTIQEIQEQLNKYKTSGKKIFVTSSFQTHSIPLLHILSQAEVEIDVLFINTGFHFAETLTFRDEVAGLLGLNLIDVRSLVPKNQQKDADGQFYFVTDPDYCCFLNKTQPLEPYLMQYDIWISGVRADQSAIRKNMKTEQPALFDTIRFNPILEWNAKQIYEYQELYNLPENPLDEKGYQSIGCVPCTQKYDLSDERSARWFGMSKTECGLHTDLISN